MITLRRIFIFLFILLIYPLFSIGQKVEKTPEMLLDTTTTEGRPGIVVSITDLPGQRFVLEIPEVFTLRGFSGGLLGYKKQSWSFNNDGANVNIADDKFRYSIQLRMVKSKNSIGLKWNISFKNLSDSTLYDLASFNCWSMNTAPLFKDLSMKRTFVYDSVMDKIPLKDVRKNQGIGKRTMQFYPAVAGIDLSKSLWINQWGVISDQHLSGKKVSIVSTDSSWLFENIINGKVAYFFNNWESDHGCLHASPLLAKELRPGETAEANGIFRFTRIQK